MIKKTARVGQVLQQDDFRRKDMLCMSPAERIKALIVARDMAFDYKPLKRVACIRKLG
ncbi:hypothetical protein SCARR_00293 [Pontiella sulfatireligans]|uniref:Uncharacterized protein n=1 Tax=Pontiella sulfatireligans TaxID=2750658 RepID=A0A6C2UFN3_9BACT|nr:hypothetical protein SCARR_00293 [Pontiella sulfatireligans]